MKLWKMYVKTYLSYQNQSVHKVSNHDLDHLTPKSIDIFIWPSCIYVLNMEAVRCMNTTHVIVSGPECWPSSVVTLTFNLLTQKCIGIFLSPSCIYACNIKAVRWKLLKLSSQNLMLTLFSCDLDLWLFLP